MTEEGGRSVEESGNDNKDGYSDYATLSHYKNQLKIVQDELDKERSDHLKEITDLQNSHRIQISELIKKLPEQK
ncbi:hypothetical protein PG994_003121 [Apiospora phragmitis]|uniref:Dehydrin n=1 Tax=Apiospora phragmitis TaxID=2905665 RepID=A0ABR1W755_9PEZI